MSKKIVLLTFISLFFLSAMIVIPVVAQERIVFVKAGDWVRYGDIDFFWNYSYSIPEFLSNASFSVNDTQRIRYVVEGVYGLNVTYSHIHSFKNGSDVWQGWIDVETGENLEFMNDTIALPMGPGWLVSASLSEGDSIWAGVPLKINKTVLVQYLGMPRWVNVFNMTFQAPEPYEPYDLTYISTWDRYTGVLCKMTEFYALNGTVVGWMSMEIDGTNLWGSYTFPITVEAQNFTVHATSNSSISDLEFNQSLNQISFNVKGFTGTTGFCNISIPQNLLWGEFSIYKNNSLLLRDIDYTQTQNGTHYIFYITYTHTIHVIEIRSTEVIPEFPSIMILPLFILVTLLTVVIYRRKTKP